MTKEIIIRIAFIALLLLAYFVGYYFYIKAKLLNAAAGAIDSAEQDGKTGEEKRAIAVDQIYALVPAFLKPLFPKSVIEGIMQSAFYKIESYAEKQIKKSEDKNKDN